MQVGGWCPNCRSTRPPIRAPSCRPPHHPWRCCAPAAPSPVSAWMPALRWSATPRPLAVPCTRRWSRACSMSTRPTAHKASCPTTTRRPRTSTLSRCTATTPSRAWTGCPIRTRSRLASRRAWWTRRPVRKRCAWASCSATCCARSASPHRPTARPTARRWSSGCRTRCWWGPPACCRAGPSTARCSTAPTSSARCGPSSVPATRPDLTARSAPPTAWHEACRSSWRWAGSGRSTATRRAPASRLREPPAAVAPGTPWAASTTA